MRLRHEVATRAVIKRRLAAPRERVFQAWTEAAHLQRWFFPTVNGDVISHAEIDLRVGGHYRITMCTAGGEVAAMVGGTYHEVHPPTRLVFSWAWQAPESDPSETLVTVEFHDVLHRTGTGRADVTRDGERARPEVQHAKRLPGVVASVDHRGDDVLAPIAQRRILRKDREPPCRSRDFGG